MVDIRKPSDDFDPWEPKKVNTVHERSDVDSGDLAQHHTLGSAPGQAAPGHKLAALQKSFNELSADYESRVTALEEVQIEAAYIGGAAGTMASGAWTTMTGFNTPFPGWASTLVKRVGPTSVTYGLGIFTAIIDVWIDLDVAIEINNSSAGRRGLKITMGTTGANQVNDTEFQGAITASPQPLHANYNGPLKAGQTLTVYAYQDSGGALAVPLRQFSYKAVPI